MRYLLIDRIVERTADRLVAIKTVTNAEEYLADHFPTFPVLPGVLMVEALVQAGRLFVEGLFEEGRGGQSDGMTPSHADATLPLVLAEVRNVRYGNMVRPGQALEVEVTLKSEQDGRYTFAGVGKVDGQVAVQGRFTLAPAPLTTAAQSAT